MLVALLLGICFQGMRCSPKAWRKRRDQQELSNCLHQTMEIAEDFNNKLGNRALEFRAEEGRGTQVTEATHSAPVTGSTLGGQYQ